VTVSKKFKTFRAFFWNALERFGEQLFQFVISTILTRLLFSEKFGLMTILKINLIGEDL